MQASSRFLFLPLSSCTTAMCLIAVSVLGLDDSFSKRQHLFCIKCAAWFLKVVSLFSFSDLQYNLTSDLLHKPSFPPRFYFHGNGSSNITNERVRARQGHLTCVAHVAYQRVIYSPTVYFGHINIWCTDWINSSNVKMFFFPPTERCEGHFYSGSVCGFLQSQGDKQPQSLFHILPSVKTHSAAERRTPQHHHQPGTKLAYKDPANNS